MNRIEPNFLLPSRESLPPSSISTDKVTSLANQTLPPWVPRTHQARNWKIAIGVISGILFSPVLLAAVVLGALYRAYECLNPNVRAWKKKVGELKERVNQHRLQAMKEVLAKSDSLIRPLSDAAGTKYRINFRDLVALLDAPLAPGKAHLRFQAVRKELRKVLQSPEYLRQRQGDGADIRFLQHLAASLKLGGRAQEPLRDVGDYLKKYGLPQTHAQDGSPQTHAQGSLRLSKEMRQIFQGLPALKKTQIVWKLLWYCAHPQKTLHSLVGLSGASQNMKKPHPLLEAVCKIVSAFGYHGEDYNSYDHGNEEQMIGEFVYQEKRMLFFLGPGLGQDREIDLAYLDYLKQNKRMHWQQSLENPDVPGEEARRKVQQTILRGYGDLFTAISLDGEEVKGFGLQDGNDFVEKYYNRLDPLVQENFVLPQEQRDAALMQARSLAHKITSDNNEWKMLSAPRKGAVLLSLFQLLATLRIMKDQFSQAGSSGVVGVRSEACKQDIDRGVVMNALTLFSMEALKEDPQWDRIASLLHGVVFSRALMVDERAILPKRFEIIPNFLSVVGATDQTFQAFTRALKEAGEGLAFQDVPSC